MQRWSLRATWLAIALIGCAVAPRSLAAQPLAPQDLTCQVQGPDVTLSWTNAEVVDAIEVRRGGDLLQTLPGTATSFADLGVPGSFHVYHVHPVLNQVNGPQITGLGATCQVQVLPSPASPLPALPASLKTLPPPLPSTLGDYVKDSEAAIRLGKALFWDLQVGSDGLTACATCHFHAGSDPRTQNILEPGPNGIFDLAGPNHRVTFADYPFHQLADVADQNSAVISSRDDSSGSQGIHRATFVDVLPGLEEDLRTIDPDPTFHVSGLNLRQVTGRNAPTVINSIYMLETFWDGRASFWFNGRNHSGPRDPNASVLQVQPDLSVVPVQILIDRASLASQAVSPPLGDREMAAHGRDFLKVAKKLLALPPLQFQRVHPADSALGVLADPIGTGLTTTYQEMIEAAFVESWWQSDRIFDGSLAEVGQGTPVGSNQYTLTEANFSLFWGLALLMYQSTLVSDDAPFDRYREGDATALSLLEQEGMEVFAQANCLQCHDTPVLSGAVTPKFMGGTDPQSVLDRMPLNNALFAIHDSGFYNIGVRPTAEDLGRGGLDLFGQPFSFSSLIQEHGLGALPFEVGVTILDPPPTPSEEVAMAGAMKTPSLRNSELTGPYFHDGSAATLAQVVEFYARGGNFAAANVDDLAPEMQPLSFLLQDPSRQVALVAFLKSLTDERVRQEMAPFDHPQLLIPDGAVGDSSSVDPASPGSLLSVDRLIEIPAVGAGGRAAESLDPLLEFLQPPAVAQIECSVDASGLVQLTWQNSGTAPAIRIERDKQLVELLPGSSVSFAETLFEPGLHEYTVAPADGPQVALPRLCSVEIAPPAPTEVMAEQLEDQIRVNWANAFPYDELEVLRDGVSLATLPAGSVESFDLDTTPGPREYSVVGQVEGVSSEPISVSLVVRPPAIATLLCAEVGGTAELSWTNEFGYDEVEIFRDGVSLALLAGSETSYSDATATPGNLIYQAIGRFQEIDALAAECELPFPPRAIDELSCALSDGSTLLTWVNGDAFDAIEVRREGTLLAVLSGSDQEYIDATIDTTVAGVVSYVLTPSVAGIEGLSTVCLVTVLPAPVGSLSCEAIETGNLLTWSIDAAAESVQIVRDGALVATLVGAETAFLDPLSSYGTFDYQVTTVVGALVSPPSGCLAARHPQPVTGLSCGGDLFGVTLQWLNPELYSAIEVLLDGVVIATLDGSSDSYTDSAAMTGLLTYSVRSVEAGLTTLAPPTCEILLGPPQVTDLVCELPGPCGVAEVQLSWVNNGLYDTLELFLDGAPLQTLPGDSTITSILLPTSGAQVLSLIAVDAGIESPAVDCTATPLDDEAPPPSILVATQLENCEVSASWQANGPYSSIEIRVNGEMVQSLSGTATSTTLSLPFLGDQTLCVVATTECGTELSPTCAFVSCVSEFRRGDINADGLVDITDTIFLLHAVFAGGVQPLCADAADANDDGVVDLSDAMRGLQAVFGFGGLGPLPAPLLSCGSDPTPDSLQCLSFPSCP